MTRTFRSAVITLALAALACASSRTASPPRVEPRDRTDDPELAAARAAARPEFETQADALTAGVYERFEHPDSVTGAAPAPRTAPPATPGVAGGDDPSTEELLGTLAAPGPYNAGAGATGERPPAGSASAREEWTLQLGAFESETGALVRIRQIAAEFPTLPRWYEREGGTVRVFVGRFADRAEAERERARLAASGYPDVWVTAVP
ncbi:MAG TPA: SPOR domain-containing protein [Gemmatimonadota bacterium]|nr:SPOR domain-containing protein [Gemmatimonadota bacterium]